MTKPENVKCPECDGPMVSRKSGYGIFWGCMSFPKCKGTRDSMGRSKAERDEERIVEESKNRGDEWPRNRDDKIRWNQK